MMDGEGRAGALITETSGNLLKDDAQALINTVNTVGVMGKGIALQFKRAFPEVFAAYTSACTEGRIQPGRIFPVRLRGSDRWVLNFPTKRHWRQPSRMEDIRTGLDDLVRVLTELDLRSVAVPPLGCGNGGLPWADVRPLILEKLGDLDLDIRLYSPGTPEPGDMPTRTQRPELTQVRARLLAALSRYITLAFEAGVTEAPRLSLVEAHKIAYLLQGAGLDLGLRFVPHKYGPFSVGLNREFAGLEGHYIIGYGDGTVGARTELEILPEAARAAEARVSSDDDFRRAWDHVRRAVIGYEYPEGMELLTTVHFLAASHPGRSPDPVTLTDEMAAWSDRKRHLFRSSDVTAALTRLSRAELLPIPY
ncbi:type II toxin-antitoxin system antitoxin DNA ADP-ribosyl glycohydrolase DarG [Planomonospora algeriensis]